ncbi:MAG: hypothetical protein VR72_17145 [Clostridiaceae bacterium BRH_c20a]|nr:MAG: hypothetical protein VR72_17145 [Clostridiaceae bacterium BRH_c20a]
MKRLVLIFIWFIGITIVIKLVLHNQPLGYFWLVVIGLSVFFGFYGGQEKKIPEDFNHQLRLWLDKYRDYPYYHRQQFLSDVVKRALKIGQVNHVEKFLNYIVETEPDNETAQSLLIALWGTEVINNKSA